MKAGQKVKFKKRSGEVIDATFVKEEDRGAGRGQGIWYTVKDVNGVELVGRVSQVTEV